MWILECIFLVRCIFRCIFLSSYWLLPSGPLGVGGRKFVSLSGSQNFTDTHTSQTLDVAGHSKCYYPKKVIHPIGEVTHWWSEKQLLPEWYQSHLLDHIKGGANIDIDVTHIGNIWPFSSDHLVSQARFVEDLMMY